MLTVSFTPSVCYLLSEPDEVSCQEVKIWLTSELSHGFLSCRSIISCELLTRSKASRALLLCYQKQRALPCLCPCWSLFLLRKLLLSMHKLIAVVWYVGAITCPAIFRDSYFYIWDVTFSSYQHHNAGKTSPDFSCWLPTPSCRRSGAACSQMHYSMDDPTFSVARRALSEELLWATYM